MYSEEFILQIQNETAAATAEIEALESDVASLLENETIALVKTYLENVESLKVQKLKLQGLQTYNV